jgi:multimeric flavodoxin WrbA
MKVLVIMGSPRKGNTFHAAEQIREILQSHGPLEFDYLWLRDENLGFCRGCFTCIAKGEENCPVKDSAPAVEQKLRDADGVIFASPVYGMNVSGHFKVFVDRFSYIFHRPRFFKKKALLLSTTGAIGNDEVLRYLRLVAQVWGFEVVGEAGSRNTENRKTLRSEKIWSIIPYRSHFARPKKSFAPGRDRLPCTEGIIRGTSGTSPLRLQVLERSGMA